VREACADRGCEVGHDEGGLARAVSAAKPAPCLRLNNACLAKLLLLAIRLQLYHTQGRSLGASGRVVGGEVAWVPTLPLGSCGRRHDVGVFIGERARERATIAFKGWICGQASTTSDLSPPV